MLIALRALVSTTTGYLAISLGAAIWHGLTGDIPPGRDLLSLALFGGVVSGPMLLAVVWIGCRT